MSMPLIVYRPKGMRKDKWMPAAYGVGKDWFLATTTAPPPFCEARMRAARLSVETGEAKVVQALEVRTTKSKEERRMRTVCVVEPYVTVRPDPNIYERVRVSRYDLNHLPVTEKSPWPTLPRIMEWEKERGQGKVSE